MTVLALSPWYVIPAMTLIALAAGYSGWRLLRLLIGESHPRQLDLVDQISRLLPQTQCGQCGFSGCAPYARAIAEGEAINKCPPGGERTIRLLADLVHQPFIALDPAHGTHMPPRVAFIRENECIGCTKCIQACPVDAILGAPKLMHTVIAGECTGCDLCVEPCPVDCIDMLTAAAQEPPQWQFPGSGQEELAGSEVPGDCIERDACANVSPSDIPRVQYYRAGKGELDQEAKQLQLSDYRKERFEARKRRLARDAAMRRGSRRRSVARPENPEIADAGLQAFSRDQARQEIAAAVARVKQRKQGQKPFLTADSETGREDDR